MRKTFLTVLISSFPIRTLSTSILDSAGPGSRRRIPTTPRLQRRIVPIPGTTKLNRLDENIGALNVELTPDDLRDIENAAVKITVQVARYPEKLEQMTGR